jgi:hypothetical protein
MSCVRFRHILLAKELAGVYRIADYVDVATPGFGGDALREPVREEDMAWRVSAAG